MLFVRADAYFCAPPALAARRWSLPSSLGETKANLLRSRPMLRPCQVTYQDLDGIRHTVTVEADSVYRRPRAPGAEERWLRRQATRSRQHVAGGGARAVSHASRKRRPSAALACARVFKSQR